MKTLTLTIAEPWFSMIREGKKKEEYREIKDHYFHQLYNYAEMQKFFGVPPQPYHFDRPNVFHTKQFQKNFDMLVLRNGYRTNRAKITDMGGVYSKLHSQYDNSFEYTLGKEIVIDDFNLMYNMECASGFHFFRTKEEAENY